MEDRGTIDLQQIWQAIQQYKVRIILIILICTFTAMGIAFILPKQYESTTLVRAKSQTQNGLSMQASTVMALIGGGNTATPTQAYMEMMKSRSVLDPVIAGLDLPEEKKDKLDNKSFAKSYLTIANTKGTDLIEVTAIGRTPEEAQQISAGVVSSFQQVLTNINQSEQSLMMKFLKDRTDVAKKEMEEAEQNLEKFRQQEKVYVPDEQAKALIKQLTEFDQKVAQADVQNQTNQAKLQGINDQLRKQNVALSTYNVADNPGVQEIRKNIIAKQMQLIELEQRYTDKHSNVILVKKEIEGLTAKLQDEVAQSVAAGTNTLNPVHGGLLKEKVETETELIAGQAAVEAVKQIRAKSENDISKLSAKSLTYIGLERQVKITQEVYATLVKNYEQTRIQEAMQSMDIQVVDQANLPKNPSAPKKMLITAVGVVLGLMLAFVYVMVLYIRGKRQSAKTISV